MRTLRFGKTVRPLNTRGIHTPVKTKLASFISTFMPETSAEIAKSSDILKKALNENLQLEKQLTLTKELFKGIEAPPAIGPLTKIRALIDKKEEGYQEDFKWLKRLGVFGLSGVFSYLISNEYEEIEKKAELNRDWLNYY